MFGESNEKINYLNNKDILAEIASQKIHFAAIQIKNMHSMTSYCRLDKVNINYSRGEKKQGKKINITSI